MMVDERARHELFGRLEDVLGAERAVTLMEHLPPVGWADVATKHDLSAEVGLVRRDLAAVEERLNLRIDGVRQELDSKLGSEVGSLRHEIGALEQRLGADIGALGQKLDSDMGALGQKLGADIGALGQRLDSDMGSLEQRLGADIGALGQKLDADIGSVRQEIITAKQETVALLRAEISDGLTAQTRTLMFAVLGALTSMAALVLAVAHV